MPFLRARFIKLIPRLAGLLAAAGLAVASLGGSEAVAPEVSISLRGVIGGVVEVGEPLFVAVRIDLPPGRAQTLPAGWRDAMAIEIAARAGGSAAARARAIPATNEPPANADEEPWFGEVWWFSAEDLKAVRPGAYVVRAALRIREGDRWKGEAWSEPAPLEIVAPSQDPRRREQKTIAQALAAVAEGAPARAAALLDDALRVSPDRIPVLVARTQVALSMGDVRAASFCLRRARALAAREKGKPSITLHALSVQIEQALADPVVRDAPSAWAQLPAGVLEPVRPVAGRAGETKDQVPLAVSPTVPTKVESAPPPVAKPLAAKSSKASSLPPAAANPAYNPLKPFEVITASSTLGQIVPAADLDDKKIRADAAGQWAASATASSQYGTPRYAPAQATGAPSVPLGMAGDNPDAWCPAKKDEGIEWLEVTFAKPVPATEVRVLQNNTPGAIAKVEVIEPNGTVHLWWEGKDPYIAPAVREIAWFVVRVPKTAYAVAKVKLTLNLAATTSGWKQIDAVQLVGQVP
ncbi:MAG: hypothetical protein Q8N18_00160 [Opitutaceae bacterium]|nr:hypothetical protein [Opitutaceae bacterium]